VRQTHIVIKIMEVEIKQEDNRTPPDFAVVVVHHRPHQLIATLVCQSVRAKLYRLQILAHAYQQPASDVQVYRQQSACTSKKPAHPSAAHALAGNIEFHGYEEEYKHAHSSRCFTRHSLASA